jgi:hypothetical protein
MSQLSSTKTIFLDQSGLMKLLAIGAAVGCTTDDSLSLVESFSSAILENPSCLDLVFSAALEAMRKPGPHDLAPIILEL